MTRRSRVAIVRSRPETVVEDIQGLLRAGGAAEALARDRPTILKENISWHFPMPGANTTPWQLEGSIRGLKAMGYDQLVCVANDTVVTDPVKGERLNKLRAVFERHGIEVLYTFRPGEIEWQVYRPKARMRILDRIYPEGIQLPTFFHGKNILHLPTLKTHIYTTTTGAMKNAFGGLLNRKRHYTHSVIHETLVDLLAIQQEIHSGLFAIMDGTTAGSGPGPRTMQPVRTDLLLASSDMVAIDAVAARIMGFDPMQLPYIRMAHEDGLGCGRVEEIEILGEDLSKLSYQFQVGDNAASRVGDLFWFSPLKVAQRLLFHSPLVYGFIFGSYAYHDKFWWPVRGTRILADWQRDNPWGQLFSTLPE